MFETEPRTIITSEIIVGFFSNYEKLIDSNQFLLESYLKKRYLSMPLNFQSYESAQTEVISKMERYRGSMYNSLIGCLLTH